MLEWIAGLIPALPLVAALWIGIAIWFRRAHGEAHERRTSRIALTACTVSLAAALVLVAARLAGDLPDQLLLGRWLSSGDFQVNLNVATDPLSLTLMILVSAACLFITRFSVNYMHREAGFHRFFLILSLFTAAMLLLVMSGNAVLTFIGWEVAGLCSYLLISFFQDRPIAAENATRAFVTNRIGDAGFLFGIALSFRWLGGVDWPTMTAGAAGLSSVQAGTLAGCFLLAAMAKSAQIPLTPWLARAMEGPTPSSALFYGAVMVHAGVYLVLRLQPLFEQSPVAMAVMAVIGLATALYGFLAGLAQTDIKSALIFSTSGQLGLMFLACGLGLWQLALVHLCGHAIFRGYQFLSAPAILYQLHGEHTRPVPAYLARQRGMYAAALQRFWLEDAMNWGIVRPVHRLASYLSVFDTAVVDRATGLPAPAVNVLSSLAQWEEHHFGAGRFMDLPGSARRTSTQGGQEDQGIVGWVTEWIATAFHRIEEQLVFKALGQGMVTVSHRMGHRLSRVERWLGRSWSWIAVMVVILAVLAGIGEMMHGSGEQGTRSSGFPLLSALIGVPLLGMIAALRARQARTAFALGLTGAVVELILAVAVLIGFQPHLPGMQFVEQLEMLPWLGVHWGVDGLSVLFLPLTALLALFIILYAQPYHQERPGAFVASVLALEGALMGMFIALNLLQFWLFAVAEVIPATFLIVRYGTSAGRVRATWQFVRSMSGGLAMLFAGIVLLGWNHATATSGIWSFDLPSLLETPVPKGQQSLIFILLFAGLAVRLALFPLHSWLPIVAKHGTVALGVVFLVGVKVGIYALLRFVLPLLPAAAQQWGGAVMALGLAGMLYGALLAFIRTDLRRLLAFAVISHTGALVAGLFSLTSSGLRGGLLLSLNLGLAAAGLFIVAGLLYHRLGTTRFHRLGGLFDAAPLLGLTFLVAMLGSIAMPGTPGFEAAHLALEGVFESRGWGVAILAASGNVLAAGYLLWAYQRIFLARNPKGVTLPMVDLRSRELVVAGLLCAVIISVGLYADPWIEMISGAVEKVARLFEAGGH
ncbi:MAG: NADH-quinone oxidoreductase subunit M [Candidatus Competibacteraceae bacterium]|nr:NADH-quinone oxidoreductase subunit M [Candidatus Competibacteraceae bacterium]